MTSADGLPPIHVLDMHVEGEPARIALDAAELLQGANPRGRRESLLDDGSVRTALMHEPRGHSDMFGAVIVPPEDPAADLGAVFMEHHGAPMSCGHATIAIATAVAEGRLLPEFGPRESVRIETPAGVVAVDIEREPSGEFRSVVLHQPTMRVAARAQLPSPVREGEAVNVTLCRGATWVLLVDEFELGLAVGSTPSAELNGIVRALRADALEWLATSELSDADREEARTHLAGSPVAILGAPAREDCRVRTFVGFGDGAIDRSPCGTAVSALIARDIAEGRLEPGQWIGVESVVGGRFEVSGEVSAEVRPILRRRPGASGP